VLVKGGGFGVLWDIVISIVGSFIGGWVFELLGITALGVVGSFITVVRRRGDFVASHPPHQTLMVRWQDANGDPHRQRLDFVKK
jgi:hypothetical protein